MFMTISKAMYQFQSFILKYGDMPMSNEDALNAAATAFFGKDTTKLELKFNIAVRLGYFEITYGAETLDEYYTLSEKGAEYLKKREDVQLKWIYGIFGTLIGSASVGIIELIKYLIERFSNGG